MVRQNFDASIADDVQDPQAWSTHQVECKEVQFFLFLSGFDPYLWTKYEDSSMQRFSWEIHSIPRNILHGIYHHLWQRLLAMASAIAAYLEERVFQNINKTESSIWKAPPNGGGTEPLNMTTLGSYQNRTDFIISLTVQSTRQMNGTRPRYPLYPCPRSFFMCLLFSTVSLYIFTANLRDCFLNKTC